MSSLSSKIFRAIIIVLGLLNIFIGINVGFGGIATLGLQGQTEFFEVTNENIFLMRDSHIRFLGGLYGGIGLFLILAATNLNKYQTALRLIFAVIFVGGLARFTMMRFDVIFGQDILTSVLVELILMPVLYVWSSRILKSNIE